MLMLSMSWLGAAVAQELAAEPASPEPGSDASIHAQVEQLYGRSLPEAGVCVERPALGEPFAGDPTPVGVQRGARGCVLIGVVVAGTLRSPEEALAAAVEDDVWSNLGVEAGVTALRTWTDAVMLAFDQPTGSAAVTGTGNRWVVTRRLLRRGDGAGQSEEVEATLTWNAARELVSAEEDVQVRWLTTLYVRPDKVSGLPEGAVDRALTDHGRVVRQCFTDAWTDDLAQAGRVRLKWDVAGGKVGTVAVITEDGTDEDLARCYARAVRSGAYPAEASGTVTWIFGIERRRLTGP
jgi:hypothetical protein